MYTLQNLALFSILFTPPLPQPASDHLSDALFLPHTKTTHTTLRVRSTRKRARRKPSKITWRSHAKNHCPLSTVHCSLFTVHFRRSLNYKALSTVPCPLSTVHFKPTGLNPRHRSLSTSKRSFEPKTRRIIH
jgi:hypothetical protein